MKRSDVDAALVKWREILGNENVYAAPVQLSDYTASVCAASRSIAGVLFPDSTKAIFQIVGIARSHRVPLYPVSRGRNWGLGSRLPVQDGAVIVDLSRMNCIHEVNAQMCYAVVEPGVTQQQLYEYIQQHKLPVCMNVTGSSKDSSLIGNALERGVGYFDSKYHGLSNLEVVLGNGKIMRTGFGHYAGAQTASVVPAGIGPDMTGLFSQSNFGIVTCATVALLPASEVQAAMVCRLHDEKKLPLFIDALAALRRDGVFQTAVHIVNQDRSRISICPLLYAYLTRHGMPPAQAVRQAGEIFQQESLGAWSAVVPLRLRRQRVLQTCKEVRRKLRGIAEVQLVTDRLMRIGNVITSLLRFIPSMQRKHAMLDAIKPFYEMTKGIPTDAALGSVVWPVAPGEQVTSDTLDNGPVGLRYCLPVIPMTGTSALRLNQLVDETFTAFGFTPYISMNMMNAHALECVINLAFDKENTSQAEQARACIKKLHQLCLTEGFVPYRSDIQNMSLLIDAEDPFWQTVTGLKEVFDPDHILAPGRYSLPRSI